jgi:hypothetical protein
MRRHRCHVVLVLATRAGTLALPLNHTTGTSSHTVFDPKLLSTPFILLMLPVPSSHKLQVTMEILYRTSFLVDS